MSKSKDLNKLIEELRSNSNVVDIDSDDLTIQIILRALEAKRYQSDTSDRKWLAIWTAFVVTAWLTAVILILIFNEAFKFNLSTTVLVTLLGTTTLNVLGLSFIVLRGHFQSTAK